MNESLWNIFNRNMKDVIHRTEGESRSRDVREVIHFLRENNLWWPKANLLNIGMGDGEEAVLFAKEGLTVLGLTHSLPEHENAKTLGIASLCCDFHDVPIIGGQLDYIYGHDVVEHFISPIIVFTQCRRLLRMGGILAFHYPTISDAVNWTHWFMESPNLIFTWFLKFGFQLLCHTYKPGASSEFLYIAQKIELTQELYEKGGNVVYDMVRELEQYYLDGGHELVHPKGDDFNGP